jgi:hypothetical protein
MFHVPQLFSFPGMQRICNSQFCSLFAQGRAQSLLDFMSNSNSNTKNLKQLGELHQPLRTAFNMLFRPSPPLRCSYQTFIRRHFHQSSLLESRAATKKTYKNICMQVRMGGGMGSPNQNFDPIRHSAGSLALFAQSAQRLMREACDHQTTCAVADINLNMCQGCNNTIWRWLVVTDNPSAIGAIQAYAQTVSSNIQVRLVIHAYSHSQVKRAY